MTYICNLVCCSICLYENVLDIPFVKMAEKIFDVLDDIVELPSSRPNIICSVDDKKVVAFNERFIYSSIFSFLEPFL